MARGIVIWKRVRTVIGTYGGSFMGVPATELGAAVVRETLRRTGLEAALVTRLLHSLRRDGVRPGIATLCIGGDQGIALALEAAQ